MLRSALWAVSSTMGDSPAAGLPASASDEAEAAMRTRAAAALASSGSTLGAPVVGAALTSDDLSTWAGQVEAECARVNERFDGKLVEMSATVYSAREVATACAHQVANLDVVLCQFVEKSSGRVAASQDDGDALERHRQKAQMTTELATWNKMNTTRKLWIIRVRIPPNLGDSPADLQSFVGEAIYVTANVASQFRSFGSLGVRAYGPRVGGPPLLLLHRLLLLC